MVTRVSEDMLDPGAIPSILAELGLAVEIGDFCWSARASKAKWLKCGPTPVSRATYAALFAEIGVTYGAGNGSTTFNLPDPEGRALIGAGSGSLAEEFAAAAVTVATDLIAVASNVDRWITGMKVRATTTGTLPTGLVAATDYFVIRMSAVGIKLASTLANALAGTAIDITAQGSGTHTLTHTLTARAVGDRGGEEMHASTAAEIPPHTHPAQHSSAATGGGAGANLWQGPGGAAMNTGANAGGGGAHNNMQPYLVENLFIYAGV